MGDGATSERSTLDLERMRAWLVGPQVVDREGRVWSWHCDDHPGYPYPEAGGLWLGWAADALAPDDPRAAAVARWLVHELDADRIGRDGIAYAFDLGVVLRGLLGWSRATGTPPSAAIVRGAARLCAAIEARRAAWSERSLPARWSTRFGGHHLKLLFALAAIERAGVGDVDRARAVLVDTTPGDAARYLHAHAYALEGHAFAIATGVSGTGEVLDRELARLALAQRSDGGLPAWWPAGSGAAGPARSDATAQAVRLWAWRDRGRWREPIARALGFLARLSTGGATRYDDSCADRNTWCTLFALQAAELAAGDAELATLL